MLRIKIAPVPGAVSVADAFDGAEFQTAEVTDDFRLDLDLDEQEAIASEILRTYGLKKTELEGDIGLALRENALLAITRNGEVFAQVWITEV